MMNLESATLFTTGGSQAVRLPKKFSFKNDSKVYIHKCGNKVILEPVDYSWKPLLEGLAALPDDLEIFRDPPDYTDQENLF